MGKEREARKLAKALTKSLRRLSRTRSSRWMVPTVELLVILLMVGKVVQTFRNLGLI
jgi:hypothetical protein